MWNRSLDKVAALVQDGASAAGSPAEAAARADYVVTMVADPAALAEVTEGPQGVAAGARDRATVVEMSTVGPAAIERLRSALRPEVGLVDAPVLGSLSEVEAGTLRIFAGGTTEAFERVAPLLSELGSPLHAGDLGSGAAAKLGSQTR